jgi:hypothetical protein
MPKFQYTELVVFGGCWVQISGGPLVVLRDSTFVKT